MDENKEEKYGMSKIKLIFFDMEGTIFEKPKGIIGTKVAPSAWGLIARRLGKKAWQEEKLTHKKWNNREYSSYIEWMEETIKIHKKYKLTEDTFCTILDGIKYMPGVKETFENINNRNIPTCLISGGFKYQGDKAVRDLKIKHAFIGCEYFWNKKGLLDHWNLLPSNEKGKLDFMKLLIKEYGFSSKECAFIGDGKNDVAIAKAVGISIAFNAQDELNKVVTYSIKQKKGKEDFREICDKLFS